MARAVRNPKMDTRTARNGLVERREPYWTVIAEGCEDGEEAAVVEALAEDGVTVVDLVAWPINDPTRFATATGAGAVLGENVAADPSTYFGHAPLRLFRTPLAWLQAGCDGSVILDQARGARWLLDLPSARIAAEDDEHAEARDLAVTKHLPCGGRWSRSSCAPARAAQREAIRSGRTDRTTPIPMPSSSRDRAHDEP